MLMTQACSFRVFLPCMVLLGVLSGCTRASEPEPQTAATETPLGSVQTGEYPNLFAEAGYDEAEIDAKVEAAFKQLFEGDPENEALYYPAGTNENGPLAYIYDVNNEDVRSEGMSYGMMIAVQMHDREKFDAIWNWAKTYMYQSRPEHPARGFFAWSVKPNGQAIDEMPAPDGEEYFVMALYFAAARWGTGEGIYNYKAEADRLLTDMVHREPITGLTKRGAMTAESLFDRQRRMVRFTPDVVNKDRTDPSYHLPAFYELWARVGPIADRTFWAEAAQVSRDYLYKAAHPRTALTPDYSHFDGTPWAAPWRRESVDFRHDAWRSAMNWSVDWSWWRKDPRQVDLSTRLQAFFASQGLDDYASLYTLDGQPLGGGHAPGLVAMNATASLASDHPLRLEFVKALWEQPIPTGRYRYYDGMLYMLGLLHCSGKFRAWM